MGMWDRVKNFFRKKTKIAAYFVDEAGRLHRKEKKYKNGLFEDHSFGEDPQTYIVDQEHCFIEKRTGLPSAFYHVNDPRPIQLKHERPDKIDGVALKKILESKAIRDLFADDQKNLLMVILILVCITAVLVIANVYLTWQLQSKVGDIYNIVSKIPVPAK